VTIPHREGYYNVTIPLLLDGVLSRYNILLDGVLSRYNILLDGVLSRYNILLGGIITWQYPIEKDIITWQYPIEKDIITWQYPIEKDIITGTRPDGEWYKNEKRPRGEGESAYEVLGFQVEESASLQFHMWILACFFYQLSCECEKIVKNKLFKVALYKDFFPPIFHILVKCTHQDCATNCIIINYVIVP
jgi:hypothetical protein